MNRIDDIAFGVAEPLRSHGIQHASVAESHPALVDGRKRERDDAPQQLSRSTPRQPGGRPPNSSSVVTKTHLILEIARACGTTRKEGKAILDVILDGMVRALRRGESVEVRRFGVFQIRKRRPRIGRNPLTGAQVEVLAKKVAYFRPSKVLKEMLLHLSSLACGPTNGAPETKR